MKSVVTTLFEGDYSLGVGALINSLYKVGFRGRCYAGYRGSLSDWTGLARDEGAWASFTPAEDLEIRFVPIDTARHFANYKPDFMLQVWDEFESSADAMFYFDPDIVVKCRWSFFDEWVGVGVALCEETVMGQMPIDHPLRVHWKTWAEQHGWPTVREVGAPLNSGFVAVTQRDREALNLWRDITTQAGSLVALDAFTPGDRSQPFYMVDQDALNVMSMVYPGSLSRIGPEGMDFAPGGFTMSHAAGGVKPWRKRYVKSALSGIPPTLADKGWASNLDSPIRVLSPTAVERLKRTIKFGAAIGRFIRRA